MQHPTDVLVALRDRNDSHHSLITDLKFLIAQVEASIVRIEQAIGREAASEDQGGSAPVVVLDDVTPRYLAATAALGACRAELGFAMRSLREAGLPEDGTEAAPGRHRGSSG